jgi:flagellar assembly protein FliH
VALLRQANAATLARDAIVLDLGDIMRQGEQLKAAARREADEILAAAQRRREELIHGATEQGHREGLARGLEEGRAAGRLEGRDAALVEFREQLSRLDTAWTAAVAKLEQERDGILLQAKLDVLKLAVAMGELITKRSIAAAPDIVADQLSAVLDQLSNPTRLTIRIHPQDRTIIQDALPRLATQTAASHHVSIADDPALDRGSIVATTDDGGEIDASIRTQLDRIIAVLVPGAST